MGYGGGDTTTESGAEGEEGEDGDKDDLDEEGDPNVYEFDEWDLFEYYFGFMMGSLNALPVGSYLYTCGKNLRAQQTYVNDMILLLESRDILKTVEKMSRVLLFINSTFVNCWRGTKELFLGSYIPDLVLKMSIVDNLAFNLGFIWTDIVMLTLATPSNTVSTYPYFMAFYVGDLLFRLLITIEETENCWYPWNNCKTATELEAIWADHVEEVESQGLNIFDNDEGWETRTTYV